MKPVSLNLRRCFSRLFGLKEPTPDAGLDGANPFQALFDRLPDPVWIIVGSNFVDANPAALNAMGLVDKASALGRHPADLSPECQPDGEQSRPKAERMMAMARREGRHRFEWMHRRPDGSIFSVEVTLNTLDWRGQPALCCHWRDLAERRRLRAALEEREAHYERVASTVPLLLYDYVMYPDETDRFLFVGPKCREILEIDPKVLEADSSVLWSRVHPEDLVRLQEENVIAFRERSDFFSTEFRITTPSGRWKWLHVGSRPGPETDQGVGSDLGGPLDLGEVIPDTDVTVVVEPGTQSADPTLAGMGNPTEPRRGRSRSRSAELRALQEDLTRDLVLVQQQREALEREADALEARGE